MIVSGILFLLVMFSIFSIKPPSTTGTVVYFLGRPIWAMQTFVRTLSENAFAVLHTKSALVRENEILREQVKELEWSTLDRDRIEKELEEWKKLVGKNVQPTYIVGDVLAKPGALLYDTFILDVGEENGVRVDDTIIVGNDIAVGKIIDVRKSISKAQFFSSAGIVTPVLVGTKLLPFEASGYGSGTLSITIPRDLAIEVGESVYMPTDPRMFIGKVEIVSLRPSDAMKLVLVRLPVNLFELSRVKILHSEVAVFPEQGDEAFVKKLK